MKGKPVDEVTTARFSRVYLDFEGYILPHDTKSAQSRFKAWTAFIP